MRRASRHRARSIASHRHVDGMMQNRRQRGLAPAGVLHDLREPSSRLEHLPTYHSRGSPSLWSFAKQSTSRALEGVTARCDALWWQLSLAHANDVAHTGVTSSSLVSPENSFQCCHGRMVVSVEPAETRSRPRARIRCWPARQHARSNTLGDAWPQVGRAQEEIIRG